MRAFPKRFPLVCEAGAPPVGSCLEWQAGPPQPPLDRAQGELGSALPAYEIGAILGSGSFAVVFAARHRSLDREVAIKVLSPALVAEAEARERFAVEARLLASLDHPHIVRVYDYVDEDATCALVMERMRGGTLAARLRAGADAGPARLRDRARGAARPGARTPPARPAP